MTIAQEDAKESPVRTWLANCWDGVKYDFVKGRLFVAFSKPPIKEFRHPRTGGSGSTTRTVNSG